MVKKSFIKMGLLTITPFAQSIAADSQNDCPIQNKNEYTNKIKCRTIKVGNEESVCCTEVPPAKKIEKPQLQNFTCPSVEVLKNAIKKENNVTYQQQYMFKRNGLKLSFLYNPATGPEFTNIPFMWGDFKVPIKFDKVRYTPELKPNGFYKIVCHYDCENETGQKTSIIVSSEFTRENTQVFGDPVLLNGAQDKKDPEGHWYTSQSNNPEDIVFKLQKEKAP